jgi:hypothetical protein
MHRIRKYLARMAADKIHAAATVSHVAYCGAVFVEGMASMPPSRS